MWRLWQTVGSVSRGVVVESMDPAEKDAAAFARQDIRRELASIVQLVRARDSEAAVLIRQALVSMGEDPASLPDVPGLPVVVGYNTDLGAVCDYQIHGMMLFLRAA